jgi:succinoglycan biosynthesis transport protein ExoP
MIEHSSSTVHFQEYFKVLRSRFWVIFTIFLLTVLSGAYVTEEVLPKIYEASTQIQIKPRGIVDVSTLDRTDTESPLDSTNFQAEFEIMQSPKVLLPVITNLGLDKKWASTVFHSNAEKITSLEALGYLSGILHIDYKRGTNLVTIAVSSEDPKEAAQIANAVATSYKAMRDDEENQRTSLGADSIRADIAQQEKIVEDRRNAVDRLRDEAAKKGVNIDPRAQGMATLADTDLDKRKQDLLAAKEDADSRRVLMESVAKLNDDQFVDTLSGLGREESNIANLRTDSFKLEADIDNLVKGGYGADNPRVTALQAELDRHRKQIKDLIAGTRQAIIVDTQMANSRVDLLEREVKDLTIAAQGAQTSDLQPFRDAQHEYERQLSLLDAYKVRLNQVISDSRLMESPVRIIALAEPPEFPSKPNKTVFLGVSVLAGLFLGILVAFIVEYLDTSVKTMADAESLLGLPVLTVIPNKGGPMPLTATAARFPHAEGYRILRAKLDLKVQDGIGPSLSVISGGPGEGKSTTIYNVAVVCAQAGQSVILVDCDLRRPSIHQMVGLSNEQGLANYLKDEGDSLDYIQPTALSNLHVLPAGEMSMADIGSLNGDKIRAMLDELKQRYDLVLLDSPPILGISDGSIIAREVDYVILVIQHRRYPREISLRAKRAIEEVHGNCVGMVLNSVAVKSDDSYYYYSNYGNYYKDKGGRKKKKKTPVSATASAGTNGKPALASTREQNLESDEF